MTRKNTQKFRVFNICACSTSQFIINNLSEMEKLVKVRQIDCGIFQYYREDPCLVCGCILYFSKPYSQEEIEFSGIKSILDKMKENYISVVEVQQ